MFEKFYPDYYLDSTYHIDFKKAYEEGYRGLIFDIDNTLVPHGAPADSKSIKLMEQLKAIGFQIMLLSNNQEPRVKSFHDKVKVPYIFDAHKPQVKNYKKAMELMGTNTSNTLFIGDQLFTDVLGANRTGIKTYLVKPIHPKEEIQIVLKRFFEKIILFFYKRKMGGLS